MTTDNTDSAPKPETAAQHSARDGFAGDDNLAILRKECEHRIEVCRVNILEAGFAVRHMNPRRATELLDQCEHYAMLAAYDARELTRRLLPANQITPHNAMPKRVNQPKPPTIKYLPEQIKDAMIAAKIRRVEYYDCAVCDESIGYTRKGEQLFFDSFCKCTTDHMPEPCTWSHASDWLNRQVDRAIQIELAHRFGIPRPPAGKLRLYNVIVEYSIIVLAESEIAAAIASEYIADDAPNEEAKLPSATEITDRSEIPRGWKATANPHTEDGEFHHRTIGQIISANKRSYKPKNEN